MIYAVLYVSSIILVNWLFAVIPPVMLPGQEIWSPVEFIVGFVFIIRDYAQRAIGHKILLAMFAGAAISYFVAGPQIAFASMAAFLVSEMLDWAIYTWTGRPFSQRILLSSLASAPVDSMVFLSCISMAGTGTLLVMTMSKLAGALVVFFLVRRREQMATAN